MSYRPVLYMNNFLFLLSLLILIVFVLASTRSTKDSELQPIKGGSVVDMDEEQSQMVCCSSIKVFAL